MYIYIYIYIHTVHITYIYTYIYIYMYIPYCYPIGIRRQYSMRNPINGDIKPLEHRHSGLSEV